MANHSEEVHTRTKNTVRELFPVSISITIWVSLALLLIGATVLMVFGILNFGHKLGPVLIGMAVGLFVLLLVSFCLFWVFVKEDCLKKQQQTNASDHMRSTDNCPISVVNPHFDMGLPVSPPEYNLENLSYFPNHDTNYEPDPPHYANYPGNDFISAGLEVLPRDPPPAYWECITSPPTNPHQYENCKT